MKGKKKNPYCRHTENSNAIFPNKARIDCCISEPSNKILPILDNKRLINENITSDTVRIH